MSTKNKRVDPRVDFGNQRQCSWYSSGRLGLNCVDLIDRNLYERTCDVRWWATDSSITDCLFPRSLFIHRTRKRTDEGILSAYTVYHDLVIADPQGNIITNGKPLEYAIITS